MPNIDIVAYQDDEGNNIAVARTVRGMNWIASNITSEPDQSDFVEFLGRLPSNLQLAVLDPNMKTLNIVSPPLH